MAKKQEVPVEATETATQSTTPSNGEIKMVAKLSAKNAGISPKKILGFDPKPSFLAIAWIMGECVGTKAVDDPVAGKTHFPLVGRFQAIHPETGAKTQSGVLYLPSGIHDTYKAAAENLGDGEILKFAIELRTVESSSPAGYGYEAVNLLKAQSVDPLDSMLQEIEAGGKKLALTSGK